MLVCSFPLSDLSELLMVAYLSWVTWVICSRSLISSEWPERFTQGRSFPLSDLSNLLMVAHLSWAIWANCSQLLIWFEQNERIPSPEVSKYFRSLTKNGRPWEICSSLSEGMSDCERITLVAHQKWANEGITHFFEQIVHLLTFLAQMMMLVRSSSRHGPKKGWVGLKNWYG